MAAFGEGRREGIQSVIAAFSGGLPSKCSRREFPYSRKPFRVHSGLAMPFSDWALMFRRRSSAWVLSLNSTAQPWWLWGARLHGSFSYLSSPRCSIRPARRTWLHRPCGRTRCGTSASGDDNRGAVVDHQDTSAACSRHSVCARWVKRNQSRCKHCGRLRDADLQRGTIWFFISAGILIAAGVYFCNVSRSGPVSQPCTQSSRFFSL